MNETRIIPQETWGNPGDILAAYLYYQSTIPENALEPHFFAVLGEIRKLAYEAHERLKSWEKVSKEKPFQPVPGGTLSTFVKDGYLPLKWFEHFGLPTFDLARTCHCGMVHTTKRCISSNHKAKPRNRLSINLDSPESAARSIKNNMDPKTTAELIELLKKEI